MQLQIQDLEQSIEKYLSGELSEKQALKHILNFLLNLTQSENIQLIRVDNKKGLTVKFKILADLESTLYKKTNKHYIGVWKFLYENIDKGKAVTFFSQPELENLHQVLPGYTGLAILPIYLKQEIIGFIHCFNNQQTLLETQVLRIQYYYSLLTLLMQTLHFKASLKAMAVEDMESLNDLEEDKKILLNYLLESEKELEIQLLKTRQLKSELNESNQILAETSKMASIGSWELDPEKDQFSWSESIYEMHEIPQGKKIGLEEYCNFFVSPHDELIRNAFHSLLADKVFFDLKLKINTQESGNKWIRIVGKVIRSGANQYKYFGLVQDIHQVTTNFELVSDLSSLFELSTEPMVILDPDGRIIHSNPAFSLICQGNQVKYQQRSLVELVPDPGRTEINQALNLIRTGLALHASVNMEWMSDLGMVKIFSWNFSMDEERQRIYGIARDITEILNAQKHARENEILYRSVAENFPSGTITIIDELGKIIFTEGRGYTQTHWKPENLLGKNIFELASQPFAEQYLKNISYVLNGETREFETEQDGFYIHFTMLLLPDQQTNKIMVLSQDLTRRLQAEEKLKKSETRYKNLVENAPMGMMIIQEDRIVFSNPEALNILKASNYDQIAGQKCQGLLFSEDKIEFRDSIEQALDAGEVFNSLASLRRLDQQEILVEAKHLMMEFNDRPAIQVVFQDVSARHKYQQEKDQLLHILDHSHNEIYVFDAVDYRFLFVNQSGIRNIGYSREELYILTPLEISPEFDIEKLKMLVQPLMEGTSGKIQFETIHRRKNGTSYPIEVNLEIHEWGKKKAFFAIINDISEIQKQRYQNRSIRENLSFAHKVAKLGGWEYNLDSHQLTITSEYLNIFGIQNPSEKLMNIGLKEYLENYVHPECREELQNKLSNITRPVSPDLNVKLHHRTCDIAGREHFLEVTAVYKSEHSISGITQDVTLKEEIQRKLKDSEANLKALFDSTNYAFILLDSGLHIISFNEAARKIALKITGLEPSVGDELQKYIKEPFKDDFNRMVASACVGNKEEDDLALITNGVTEWFNIQLVPVKNQHQVTTNISLIIRDITEKKAQEEKIISLNDRLKFAADIGNVGWWEWDYPSGKVTFDDKKATLLDYQPSDFSHVEDFKRVIHPEDYEMAIARMTEHLSGRSECYEIVYRLRKKDGSYHWFYDKGFVSERFEDNQPKTIKGAILDIHQLKTSQENLLLQNQELRKSNHELDTFVYRISHDMRAPLSSAMGLIDLCHSESDLEKVKNYLKLQYRSLKKMDDFIYDIVDYSKNSRVEVKPEKILIRKFFIEMLNQFSYHPTASNIQREIKVEGVPYFYADPFRMRIIFQNLLSNAFRYSKRQSTEGWVKLSAKNNQSHVTFIVEDNGIGIEPNHLPKVFDMFYRATVQDPGEGLGLYIVKEAVAKSGGTIEVESCFKKWTRFKVNLPFGTSD